jgi:ATP-dependent RNA helicase HelY
VRSSRYPGTRTAGTADAPPSSGDSALVDDFETAYGFPFDPFQRRACEALAGDSSVLVAAPTGAGKTVVGEFATWLAMKGGGKTFYTTPIKALSNQKFGDFVAVYGADDVGLLTGDNSINAEAPIVVMTTEVLRNMIYEDSETLSGLHYVVLDEVHYLQNPYRGAVWEEVLIHLPVDVRIVSLSATVSNAEEFAEWLQTLRGRTEVIIEERRPIEIRHWYMGSDELIPMFVTGEGGELIPNPRGKEFDRRKRPPRGPRPGRRGRRTPGRRVRVPFRSDVVEMLADEEMLPAIYFIFSRKGCAEAVRQCVRGGLSLTTSKERETIRQRAEARVSDLPPGELAVLGYDDWISGLERGIAAHHAGMIPPFKEAVEELFAEGFVKVVFATETLALGINMPARTVVIESLMKFTGEKHEQMTPGEFTQLTGRAGRRGKDQLGHGVVLLQRYVQFDGITRLATTRTYPLQSSFRPSYNMAVNLVQNYDLAEAEHLVNSSFAQYQTDKGVVRLETTREELEAYFASYRDRMECDRGDFNEYRNLRGRLQKLETGKRPARSRVKQVTQAIANLSPGDVIDVPSGKRRGRYAVIEVTQTRSERRPRVLALNKRGSLIRFGPADLPEEPRHLGRLALPDRNRLDKPERRKDLGRDLAAFVPERQEASAPQDADAEEIQTLRNALASHPVGACPELGRHIHFSERATRLEREIRSIERRIKRSSGTLARMFEQVLGLLESLGYVEEWTVTAKGRVLTRVYSETDLLVVEALEDGLLIGLEPAELAAVCSTLVYETRGPEGPPPADMPTAATHQAWVRLMKLWRTIRTKEEGRGLELTREPDPGFATTAYLWASGRPLEQVLDEEDAPGDFVRSVKQLIDLLRQLLDIVPPGELSDGIEAAIDALQRGVVAYSSLEV